MKRFATVIFLNNYIRPEFLYKDIGAISYGLAKYYGYQTDFIYLTNDRGIIKDSYYEKYVTLVPIKGYDNKFIAYFHGVLFMWKNAKKYDVINFYPGGLINIILASVAKVRNLNIRFYMKFDMERVAFNNKLNSTNTFRYRIASVMHKIFDLYTVETISYLDDLNKLREFQSKVKYLPNGFFSDLVNVDSNLKKEKIILTVGRLGTEQKNTEMLIQTLNLIDRRKIREWKVYLVGTVTEEFKRWYEDVLERNPYLKEVFIMTGNISDKRALYTLYAKASVFVLTSRREGFPLSLQEALHYKCYPIVTDCCDAFKDVIIEGECGFGKIVPNEDMHALKEAIEEVLDNKIDFIKKGKLAGKIIDSKFDWRDICGRLDEYLQKLN